MLKCKTDAERNSHGGSCVRHMSRPAFTQKPSIRRGGFHAKKRVQITYSTTNCLWAAMTAAARPVDSAEVMRLLSRCCPARPKNHTWYSAAQELALVLLQTTDAFHI